MLVACGSDLSDVLACGSDLSDVLAPWWLGLAGADEMAPTSLTGESASKSMVGTGGGGGTGGGIKTPS